MKNLWIAIAIALSLGVSGAYAKQKLSEVELDSVTAGAKKKAKKGGKKKKHKSGKAFGLSHKPADPGKLTNPGIGHRR